MISGIPQSDSKIKMIPKRMLYEKFSFTNSEKTAFDRTVHRIDIIAEISQNTVNIAPGREVRSIFILEVQLQSKKYDIKCIRSIFNLIPQNMVLVLTFDRQSRFVVKKDLILEGDWMDSNSLHLPIKGMDLDAVWDNIIMNIGGIEMDEDTTLVEQIHKDAESKKIQKRIDALEKKINMESQPRTKYELHQEKLKLMAMKKAIETGNDSSGQPEETEVE